MATKEEGRRAGGLEGEKKGSERLFLALTTGWLQVIHSDIIVRC